MVILLSPAKTLDFSNSSIEQYSHATHLADTMSLLRELKRLKTNELMDLMSLSEKLAIENKERYQVFSKSHTLENSKQALLAFKGDVYLGIDADTMTEDQLLFAQKHLRILSGLYGLLSPLDLIQPYRLEMGTRLSNKKGKNLYEFWNTKISRSINQMAKEQHSKLVLNLASEEYFRAVDKSILKLPVLTAQFKEFRNGTLSFVSFNAKKARGLMTRFIIDHKIHEAEDIKGFDKDGYAFSVEHSKEDQWLFVR